MLEAEVVGDGIAVDLPVDAGEGAGAERHHRGAVEGELEAQHVAGEHPEVGEQVVAEVDRLGALQVGVAGHRPVAMALGQLEQPLHRRAGELDRPQRVRLDDHRHVGGDLVVARAAGVQLAGQRADLLAEQALDRHVDVLVGLLELEAVLAHAGPDPLEPGVDLRQLGRRRAHRSAQAAGVRLGLVDVVGRQPPVELDRAIDPPEAGIGVFAEARHQRMDSARASHTRVDLGLAHRREEGQRQRTCRGSFGNRELPLAVAQLAQVGEEVDAGQVGLAGDAPLGEPVDRRVAVAPSGSRTV